MFAKLVILVSALALTVAAAPGQPGPTSQCNVGELHCCNSVQEATSDNKALLHDLLGIDIASITGQIGLTCNPVDVIGVSGNSCTAQPVCCTDNNFNGLVVVGCTPVNANL